MRFLHTAAAMTLGAAALTASAQTANAQQLTNNITCSQAQQIYASQGSIRTRTRMGSVVTLSGGVPATQRSKLTCIRSTRMPKFAMTSDSNRCPISYSCR